ncbi:phage tail protein [Lysinibacillus sp. LZ02]|uniref:phage tail protein n=1 Tax=Lysinibacillus sp. LZ02 TaxID=3420668 RepID=UPI003D359EEC
MAEPFIGEIRPFAFGVIPQGWASCNGQILSVQQNSALFSLIGNTYGGDGKTTFALPNLQGRVPIHVSPVTPRGTSAGEAAHTLTVNEIPSHNHQIAADSGDTNKFSPLDAVWGSVPTANVYAETANVDMNSNALSQTGQGDAHNNMQPYCTLSFCIALQGIYPPRW